MKPKKNVFGYFVNTLFLMGVLYALACGVIDLGTGREYPYLLRGTFLVLLAAAWVLLNAAAAMAARLELEDVVRRRRILFNVLEAVLAVAVLAAAAWVRIYIVRTIPMQPGMDFKTFYEIAEQLNNGTLQKNAAGYCEYLALFPHVYGYPHFLSTLFCLYGTRVSVAQYANVALSVATVFLVYRTGRLAGGRLAGLTALVLSAFWPSQVLFVTMAASEFLFSFWMMLGVYLFVLSIKTCTAQARHPGLGVLLYIAIGLALGIAATVRPMAVIVVITILLCIFPQKLFLSAERMEHPSISMMILSAGWMRCLIVILCYVLITTGNNISIEQSIGRRIAGGGTSFGYNLLVGLNTASEGGWSAEDSDFLYRSYAETGDADQAHLACRDLALVRLTGDPAANINLFLRKYHALWSNDDYGRAWNALLLGEQGNLTPARESFLRSAGDVANVYYLLCLALAGVAGIFLWRKGNDTEYIFVLIFVGTAGLHLFVENQNRYHYQALFMLALLAGCAVSGIYRMNRAKVLKLREEKEARQAALRERQERIEKKHRDEEELTDLRKKAMQSKFDMKDALERNLIRVTVTEAYRREDKQDEA